MVEKKGFNMWRVMIGETKETDFKEAVWGVFSISRWNSVSEVFQLTNLNVSIVPSDWKDLGERLILHLGLILGRKVYCFQINCR